MQYGLGREVEKGRHHAERVDMRHAGLIHGVEQQVCGKNDGQQRGRYGPPAIAQKLQQQLQEHEPHHQIEDGRHADGHLKGRRITIHRRTDGRGPQRGTGKEGGHEHGRAHKVFVDAARWRQVEKIGRLCACIMQGVGLMDECITEITVDECSRQIAVIAPSIGDDERILGHVVPARKGGEDQQADAHHQCQSPGAQHVLFAEEVVLQDAVDGPHAIAPAYLLAILVGTAVVGDAHLIDAHLGDARYLGRHFGLEPETVLLQLERLHHAGIEELVAGLHVGEVEVGEHVAQEGEELVAYRVPEEENTVRIAPHEPRTEHHIGIALDDGFQQVVVFPWVVFEVGILNDDVVACGQFNAFVQRGPFAHVHRLREETDVQLRVLRHVAFHRLNGIVLRAIIHNDELFGYAIGKHYRLDAVQYHVYRSPFVICRDDYG